MKDKGTSISSRATVNRQGEELRQRYLSNTRPDATFTIMVSMVFLTLGLFLYQALFISQFYVDDMFYIVFNPYIRGVSLTNIVAAFTHTFTDKWAPLHIMAYMVLYQLFGLNSPAFHMANVFLQVSDGVLLYLILWRMTGNKYAGVLAGLFYIINPIQSETVMFVAEMKTTLADLFIFSSFLCYIRYRQTDDRRRLVAGLFLWCMALMSKGTAFMLPVMFFIYDLLFYRGKLKKAYKGYIVLVGIGFGFALSYLFLLRPVEGGNSVPFLYHLQMAIINTAGLFTYPHNQILPLFINSYYTHWPMLRWSSPFVILSILFLALIASLAWRYRTSAPPVTFWLLWYGANFLPGSGIGNVPTLTPSGFIFQGIDHYLTLPYAGLAAITGILLAKLYEIIQGYPGKSIYGLLLLTIATSMCLITVDQSRWLTNGVDFFKRIEGMKATTSRMGYLGGESLQRAAEDMQEVPVRASRHAPRTAREAVPAGTKGGPMAYVPAGWFWMGCSPNDTTCMDNEKPYHLVYLDAYFIDKDDVTTNEYTKCVRAGGCTTAATGSGCNAGVPGRGDDPINCVDWDQANAYCRWAGKQLPTEAQWEKAARGTDGRIYPWGNKGNCNRSCNSVSPCSHDHTCRIGSYPLDRSPYGVMDMAGNVADWCADWYGMDYTSAPVRNPAGPSRGAYRILRGGSWDAGYPSLLRASLRYNSSPSRQLDFVGVRCVYRTRH